VRIVILGATGHIGSWLVPRLVRSGHDVVAVSRGQRAPYHDAYEWTRVERVTMDRAEAEQDETYGARVAAMKPEVVIDLICFERDSAAQLVEALRDRVALFLHCGTLWVHGAPRACPVSESAVRNPFGEYGVKKAAIEQFLLEEASRGFPVSVLHPGHISGPGWVPINPAGNLDVEVFAKLARGDILVLPDNGGARLQHVHADDVAQAFALAVDNGSAAIGHAFHVAAQEPVTMREYAEQVAAWFGREAWLEYAPFDEWATGVTEDDARITRDHVLHSPCASIYKICTRLGFNPRYSAAGAARDGVDWLVANGTLAVP
jgi:nucleoside-diphosphate-sugar epimerase